MRRGLSLYAQFSLLLHRFQQNEQDKKRHEGNKAEQNKAKAFCRLGLDGHAVIKPRIGIEDHADRANINAGGQVADSLPERKFPPAQDGLENKSQSDQKQAYSPMLIATDGDPPLDRNAHGYESQHDESLDRPIPAEFRAHV